METVVIRMVLDSAKRLELPAESPVVSEAILTARLALIEGRDAETAADLGRSVLVRATSDEPLIADLVA